MVRFAYWSSSLADLNKDTDYEAKSRDDEAE